MFTRQSFTGFIRAALPALLVTVITACAATDGRVYSKPGTETTLIMTRHAERLMTDGQLTAKGRQRAENLVDALAGFDVDAIYCTDLDRNRDTARPLSEATGVEVTLTPSDSTPLVESIVADMLDKYNGGIIVWIGNVGNLNRMYWHLGGSGDGPIVYGDIFVVTIPDAGPARIDRRDYSALKPVTGAHTTP